MTTDYVTVFDAGTRSGWLAARRTGNLITHRRLSAPKAKPEEARAEAEKLFPDLRVWVTGDPNPPWKEAA